LVKDEANDPLIQEVVLLTGLKLVSNLSSTSLKFGLEFVN